MRLLYFERNGDGSFRPAHAYPELAQVSIGTHDLPTLPCYWCDHDIGLRAALNLLPGPDGDAALREDRGKARTALLRLLREAGFLADAADDATIRIEDLVDAAYAFLASSPGRLLMAQLDDVLGVEEQANLPGTVDEHPNWRRKLPLAWEDIATGPRLRAFGQMLTRIRPR
jgi:(1->4)-alpha-D-glucan 1-alpha-D-glucosylmutase